MNDLGRFHIVQPVSNSLYRGDEGFWGNDFGIEGDQSCVHLLVGVELDVCSGHTRQAVEFLTDFRDTCYFAHHARYGKLGNGFLCCTSAVYVLHLHVALRTA